VSDYEWLVEELCKLTGANVEVTNSPALSAGPRGLPGQADN